VTSDVPGVGRVAFVMPTIDEDWPTELKDAMAIRRQATIDGECQCGATFRLPSRAQRRAAAKDGAMLHISIAHTDPCPASDHMLDEIARRHGLDR
jgi:hypothetical protein